ncbi:short-chain dehydrogenase/reductase SDR [Nannizzia gypsea CBS 118893]|uniref:Short-chain dehydrogenase/reductase SDR n=1 Tax=Arthroderma gypseum (strain ATCC MYA-4604 / CBS 118893) TaxID=535722 RepID=E4UYE7_ARTGP|nr:short-chain dehydrogenase/reductase SDR [Nannizzia gypsea CBS 118893]EFR02110.1 short-chain dehydrogenase/reductase SDR [Nannizzia gypsea CBS 118893]
MASYLVTGTSRGIGLALVKDLVAKPASEVSIVFAAARTKTDALKELIENSAGRIEFVSIDVTSVEKVKKAADQVEKALGGKGLDVLINNAGVLNFTPGGIETMTDLEWTFNTNVAGTHLVTRTFLPLLRKGALKQVFNMSTTMGSIGMAANFKPAPAPAYKISKAALNMLTVQYAQSLEEEGFTFVAISPGWVKTDLGGEHAFLTVSQSSAAVLKILFTATKADNGRFLNVLVPGWEVTDGPENYDGAQPPW